MALGKRVKLCLGICTVFGFRFEKGKNAMFQILQFQYDEESYKENVIVHPFPVHHPGSALDLAPAPPN